jgi:hypothetical protein
VKGKKPTQGSLFGDGPRKPEWTAKDARDEAVERVWRHASTEWKVKAWAILLLVASRLETFTANDLWEAGLPEARDNRALGPLLLQAVREGYIEPTNETRKSTRIVAHQRPMAVWRSLIWRRK